MTVICGEYGTKVQVPAFFKASNSWFIALNHLGFLRATVVFLGSEGMRDSVVVEVLAASTSTAVDGTYVEVLSLKEIGTGIIISGAGIRHVAGFLVCATGVGVVVLIDTGEVGVQVILANVFMAVVGTELVFGGIIGGGGVRVSLAAVFMVVVGGIDISLSSGTTPFFIGLVCTKPKSVYVGTPVV
uniref:Uncharacterized protein n=1 Tax=Cannabis sativa TaxID=3483 RepID=A0A803PYM8_CANSA